VAVGDAEKVEDGDVEVVPDPERLGVTVAVDDGDTVTVAVEDGDTVGDAEGEGEAEGGT
jgi:hypothetical protein